jgi:hypothetical protein
MEGFEARAFVYTGDVDDALHAVIPPEATHVRVTNSVVEIPAQTFLNRRNLETVELTHGLQIIGRDCFEGCRSLKNIIIPPTVTEIRRFAFAGCGFARPASNTRDWSSGLVSLAKESRNSTHHSKPGKPCHGFLYSIDSSVSPKRFGTYTSKSISAMYQSHVNFYSINSYDHSSWCILGL